MIGRTNAGGGASLNFKVVGGTTEPASPKENTIWVNTDVENTGWIFSASEPENPTEGMVWFSTGTDSNITFNALKKSVIQVIILFTKQYVDGAWVEKEFKIYQNGAWVNLITDILIYENGVQYRELEKVWDSVGFNADHIWMSSRNAVARFRTSKKINLTGLSVITAQFTGKVQAGNLELQITDGTNIIAAKNHTGTSSGTVSLDISSVLGEYYVQMSSHVDGYTEAKITRIHVAK